MHLERVCTYRGCTYGGFTVFKKLGRLNSVSKRNLNIYDRFFLAWRHPNGDLGIDFNDHLALLKNNSNHNNIYLEIKRRSFYYCLQFTNYKYCILLGPISNAIQN